MPTNYRNSWRSPIIHPPKSRRLTRLTTILVVASLIAVALIIALWFAAPSLLARKAAHRLTLAGTDLQLDGQPITAPIDLFQTDTQSHRVTRRQIRSAFRAAAATLEQSLGKPPIIEKIWTSPGQPALRATWEFPNATAELITGSTAEGDFARLSITLTPPSRDASQSPATIENISAVSNSLNSLFSSSSPFTPAKLRDSPSSLTAPRSADPPSRTPHPPQN